MDSQKQDPFIHSSLNLFWVILLFISLISVACMPCLAWGQGRSLGFRGLVPPAKSDKRMFKGKVILIDLPLIKIKDNLWRSTKVFVGPPGFLHEKGFPIRKGQRLIIWAVPVKVEGNEVLAAFEIHDMDTDRKVLLRNKRGEPIWWGDNRGSGKSRNSK